MHGFFRLLIVASLGVACVAACSSDDDATSPAGASGSSTAGASGASAAGASGASAAGASGASAAGAGGLAGAAGASGAGASGSGGSQAGGGGSQAGGGQGGAGQGGSEAGGGGGAECKLAKPYSTKDVDCNECAGQSCCAEVNGCVTDARCDDDYVNCTLACALLPDGTSQEAIKACLADCGTAHPEGKALYDAAIGCVDKACQAECE